MGRLFWKFFLFLWVAQILTMGGVVAAVWLGHPERAAQAREPRTSPSGQASAPPAEASARVSRLPPPPPSDLEMLLPPLISGAVVSLIIAALLAWYFATPIRNLRAALEAVARGKLDTRVGTTMAGRRDELADLGSDFDRMADRLEGVLDSQRRLMHDVSHELRSPLARVQAATDLMRQQPQRAVEFLERIERDTGRMDELVGELLTLARLDAGMTDGPEEAFDLVEILADVADDAAFEAQSKGSAIVADFDAHLPTRGNRELLHRALENVVRNAVRYTADGTPVEIAAHAARGRLRVAVSDHGPGVAEGDLDNIFAPFYRSGSRASLGFGLGLAIARRVVLAHGGSLSAANRPGGGLIATIDLPATEPIENRPSHD